MHKQNYTKEQNCSQCGNLFIRTSPNHINCSKKCTTKKFWKLNKSGTQEERYRCMDKYKRLNEGNKYRYTYMKYRAGRRGIEFLISREFFDTVYKQPCYYCGITNKVMSLDRVDSKIGYIESNIVSACIHCNQSKLGYSKEDFFKMCKTIVLKHNL